MRVNIRRLAKDIASTLGTSDTPLLNAILKSPAASIKPYLFEESEAEEKEVDMRCSYLCQRPDAPLFLQPCRQPVVWSAPAAAEGRHQCCAEHLYLAAIPESKMRGLTVLTPLETSGDGDGPYYHTQDGLVYDATYKACGRYDQASKELIIFKHME